MDTSRTLFFTLSPSSHYIYSIVPLIPPCTPLYNEITALLRAMFSSWGSATVERGIAEALTGFSSTTRRVTSRYSPIALLRRGE